MSRFSYLIPTCAWYMLNALRGVNEWSTQVPVLLLTNFGSDDKVAMKEIEKDPFAQYLVKSNWPLNDLVARVKETRAGM